MDIVSILIFIVIVGLLLWVINKIPMDGTIKNIFNGISIAALVIYLIYKFAPFLRNLI